MAVAPDPHRVQDERIARDRLEAQRACDQEGWVRNTGLLYGLAAGVGVYAFDNWARRGIRDWKSVPQWARLAIGGSVAYLSFIYGREKAWDKCVMKKIEKLDPQLYRDLNEAWINQRALLSTNPTHRITAYHSHRDEDRHSH